MTISGSNRWWKSAVVYQVYPLSFADHNADGIGDIHGIIDHLDHIRDLGVDVIWLSPVYRSPHDDNGYDISDYESVDPRFGTIEDLDQLIAAVHANGMKLILDLVVNHTSDEHPWFQESRRAREGVKANWYIWRDPRPGTVGGETGAEPNNWGGSFSGSAWEWVPERGQYYLHLFSKKQPDLNWDEPQVRAAIFHMMNRWIDRGIDGFRMDVINFISKNPAFADGEILPTGFGDGGPSFVSGPLVHEYLAEMKEAVFGHRDGEYFTVGEMPGVTPEQAARFTDQEGGQLNMVFQFEHVELDHDTGKWDYKPVGIIDIKQSLGRWQDTLAESGWNSLYWNNHDQPRVVSRWGNDREYWYESATALATVLYLHRGTPYIYQGEEIGMTNVAFSDVQDFRDIETLNYYETAVNRLGLPSESVLDALRRSSRDNARTPMQWTSETNAGFSVATPWMPVNENHKWLNVAAQRNDPSSILSFYKRLIAFRHATPVVIDGTFEMLLPDDPHVYAFRRQLGDDKLIIVANLSDLRVSPELDLGGLRVVMTNHAQNSTDQELAPWEARVYRPSPGAGSNSASATNS